MRSRGESEASTKRRRLGCQGEAGIRLEKELKKINEGWKSNFTIRAV